MSKYEEIIENSEAVNSLFRNISPEDLNGFSLTFNVPKVENHRKNLAIYTYHVEKIEGINFDDSFVICDENIKNGFLSNILENKEISYLDSKEADIKELSNLELFIQVNKERIQINGKIIAIGGGLLLNVSSYIAEKFNKDLILVPTTVISMSDGCMGGKVRVNKIEDDKYIKHFYKSFYEPNEIVVDKRFLETLSEEEIRIGLAEVVKHGIYQSKVLLSYLNSDDFKPFYDKNTLWKAILWTAALKKVCLDLDVEETQEGSLVILRGGHDISDKIEENSRFTIPHGRAVAQGIWEDINTSNRLEPSIETVYQKLALSKG